MKEQTQVTLDHSVTVLIATIKQHSSYLRKPAKLTAFKKKKVVFIKIIH